VTLFEIGSELIRTNKVFQQNTKLFPYFHFFPVFCGFLFQEPLHEQSFKSNDSVYRMFHFRDSIPLECGLAGRAEP